MKVLSDPGVGRFQAAGAGEAEGGKASKKQRRTFSCAFGAGGGRLPLSYRCAFGAAPVHGSRWQVQARIACKTDAITHLQTQGLSPLIA